MHDDTTTTVTLGPCPPARATRPTSTATTSTAPRRRAAPARAAQRAEAARLHASGVPAVDIASQLNVAPTTVARWKRAAWWPCAVEREAARLASEADAVSRRARPDALGLLHDIVRRAMAGDGSVEPGEGVKAATALLAASAPPSERQRDAARRDVLAALPAKLRRAVAEALASADLASLRELSDAELEALARGGEQ